MCAARVKTELLQIDSINTASPGGSDDNKLYQQQKTLRCLFNDDVSTPNSAELTSTLPAKYNIPLCCCYFLLQDRVMTLGPLWRHKVLTFVRLNQIH